MRVLGKKIAEDIIDELNQKVLRLEKKPVLAIVYAGSNPVIENFIKIKKTVAERLGISVRIFHFEETATTADLVQKVSDISLDEGFDGIIVQLPLPKTIDASAVLNAVYPSKDIDVLSQDGFANFAKGGGVITPPTAGAVAEVFSRYKVILKDKKIVVVGNGALVGKPVAAWLRLQGVEPIVVTSVTENSHSIFLSADIIISGAGVPLFIKPYMVKDGVVLIDAGTSEDGGKILGDIDSACEQKASIFTPVPGGVGPITVAILFKNLISTIKIK